MTEPSSSNALKHGAFSEVFILPGEDPAAYEKLEKSLFAEYNVSGCSEESTMTSIAKTMWQLQRLGVYEHVQFLRAGRGPKSSGELKNSMKEAIENFMIKIGRSFLRIHYLMFPPFRFPLRKKAKTSFCSSLVTSLPSIIWTKSWK
jgi:hypothetical protein